MEQDTGWPALKAHTHMHTPTQTPHRHSHIYTPLLGLRSGSKQEELTTPHCHFLANKTPPFLCEKEADSKEWQFFSLNLMFCKVAFDHPWAKVEKGSLFLLLPLKVCSKRHREPTPSETRTISLCLQSPFSSNSFNFQHAFQVIRLSYTIMLI